MIKAIGALALVVMILSAGCLGALEAGDREWHGTWKRTTNGVDIVTIVIEEADCSIILAQLFESSDCSFEILENDTLKLELSYQAGNETIEETWYLTYTEYQVGTTLHTPRGRLSVHLEPVE